MPLVTTVSNKKVQRSKTRKIGGKFYEENVDCFYVDGKWNRKDNGIIAFDLQREEYRKIKALVDEGKNPIIIDAQDEDTYDIGYTDEPSELFVPLMGENYSILLYALNEEVAEKAGYHPIKGGFAFIKDEDKLRSAGRPFPRMEYPFKLEYSLKDYKDVEGITALENYFSKLLREIKPTEREQFLSKYFKGHTFGIEYETNKGFLPLRHLYKSAMIPVRDGSIGGNEYVTVPLAAPTGLSLVKSQTDFLTKSTVTNQFCSLHVHIGSISKNYIDMIALYCLCYRIQEEIHELLPPYKRDINFLKSKDKDHARLLKSLDIVYNNTITEKNTEEVDACFGRIWSFLTGGYKIDDKFNPKTGKHPQEGRGKWHWFPRYHWVNFLNIFFGSGTVEFRCYQGTSSFKQVSNWLFICLAIVRYAEAYPYEIISADYKVNLEEIILAYSDNFGTEGEDDPQGMQLADYLLHYIRELKDIHTTDYISDRTNYSDYSHRLQSIEEIKHNELDTLY